MAVVVPFKAVRPRKQYAKQVASYPYDVLSSEEARAIAKDDPMSFLHVTKAEIDLPPDLNPYDDRVYEKARQNFEKQLREGVLVRDRRPCYYVYRQTLKDHEQWGIGACVHVAEFESGHVKRHEMTLPVKEADRTRHIDAVNAQTGPIFLAYRSREAINRLVRKIGEGTPEYDFLSDNGVSHTLWVVSDEETIGELKAQFKQIDRLYIADGHHRAASGVAVARMRARNAGGSEYGKAHNFILAVLFPHDQLMIRDYNRVVKDLGGLSEAEFLEKAGAAFDIERDCREKSPKVPREYGMYLGGTWFRLRPKAGRVREDDIVGALDVSILQDHLLGPVLGIRDPRGDARIRFVGGARGIAELEKMVDAGGYRVAFALYPPTIEQMMAVADAGRMMPPKSTWFEPKLRDGVLIHLLENGEEEKAAT